jgi:putative membrane protein
VALALAASAVGARDRMTWFMEVVWVIVALPLIAWRWRVFPLTLVLSVLLALHALVLIHGGMYTYAQTPLGFALRDAFRRWASRSSATRGIASVTSCRASCPPCWRANCSCAARRCVPRRGSPTCASRGALKASAASFELLEWWAALAFGAGRRCLPRDPGRCLGTSQWDMFLGPVRRVRCPRWCCGRGCNRSGTLGKSAPGMPPHSGN